MNEATAAADLRNAAMVMEHLGRGIGNFVSPTSGAVCLDGALKLATVAKLEHILRWTYSPLDGSSSAELDALIDRYTNAQLALSEILPDRCTQHEPGTCPFRSGNDDDDNFIWDENRIYHFSDFVCNGDQDSIDILIQAAEKLEAEL